MARLKVSIVFESGARIGPGKVKLLESVRDTGSISAAAREMGMSYKRAWLLLDSMNQAFAKPVIAGTPGGRHGGGAKLTAFGLALLDRIKRIEKEAVSATRKDVVALERKTRPDAGTKI
jgi:molybdate transport system regulatory protein